MEAKPKTFDEYAVRDILANRSYGITEFCCLRSIKSMYLERERYPLIVSLMENKNLAELMKLAERTIKEFCIFKTIISFASS